MSNNDETRRPDGEAGAPPPETHGEPAESEPRTPDQQLEAIARERDELLSRLQRVSADYLNFQKRMERDRVESRDLIVADVISTMLDVMDDLELAIRHARENHPAEDPLLIGTQMVHNKAVEAFKRFGVEPIAAEGEPFDPALHEAIGAQPSDEVEPNTIVAEVRKGYTFKQRTLRPSRVVVAQPVETADHGGDAHEESGEQNDADV